MSRDGLSSTPSSPLLGGQVGFGVSWIFSDSDPGPRPRTGTGTSLVPRLGKVSDSWVLLVSRSSSGPTLRPVVFGVGSPVRVRVSPTPDPTSPHTPPRVTTPTTHSLRHTPLVSTPTIVTTHVEQDPEVRRVSVPSGW